MFIAEGNGMRIPICRSKRCILEFSEPLDPMFAIGLDLPCKGILAVELEMCDRDDMHVWCVKKSEIEITHDAAYVAHISNFSDITFLWKIPL